MAEPINWKGDKTYLKILLIGQYGTGKTYLAATSALVPEMAPVVYCDFGISGDTIAGTELLAGAGIDGYRFTDFKDFVNWYNTDFDKSKYRTLILDELQVAANYIVFGGEKKKKIESWGKDWEVYRPEFDNWWSLKQLLSRLSEYTNRLPMHVITCVTAKSTVDELTGREHIGINISGSVAADLPSQFSHVWYTNSTKSSVKEPTYQVLFQPDNKHIARTRGLDIASKLGKSMQQPTMQKIYNIIMEEN